MEKNPVPIFDKDKPCVGCEVKGSILCGESWFCPVCMQNDMWYTVLLSIDIKDDTIEFLREWQKESVEYLKRYALKNSDFLEIVFPKQWEGLNSLIKSAENPDNRYEMSKWISVEDRLPSKDIYVLVSYTYKLTKERNRQGVTIANLIIYENKEIWESDGEGFHMTGVTHWRPLPKPPKE